MLLQVSCIEPVCGAYPVDPDMLSEHLQCFCGVVAVGTHQGHIYLVDMCCDQRYYDSDEVTGSSLRVMTVRTDNFEDCRDEALSRMQHLALEIGGECKNKYTTLLNICRSWLSQHKMIYFVQKVVISESVILQFTWFSAWAVYYKVSD